jgi:hypothetical protein
MLFSGMRLCLALALLGAAVMLTELIKSAQAAELLVFERQGCVRCLVWEREIAPIYAKTEEGRRAPLRRIDLAAPRAPEFSSISDVEYTPTFVLVEGHSEIGRLIGYTGDEFFWAELRELLVRLPHSQK